MMDTAGFGTEPPQAHIINNLNGSRKVQRNHRAIISGEKTYKEMGKELLGTIKDVCNGKLTKAEAYGFSDIAVDHVCCFVLCWVSPCVLCPPLVLCLLVCDAADVGDGKKLGRMGVKTVVCFLLSTAIAIVLGLVTSNVIGVETGVTIQHKAESVTDNILRTDAWVCPDEDRRTGQAPA